jgi:hypothetical protein
MVVLLKTPDLPRSESHKAIRAGGQRLAPLRFSAPDGACADVMLQADQVSVRILDDELAAAKLGVIPPVPALFQGQEDGQTGADDGGMKGIGILDADLEVDAAPIGTLERGLRQHPRSGRVFLEHELSAIAIEIGEAILGPREQDAEAEQADIESEAPVEIAAEQLRYEEQAYDYGAFRKCQQTPAGSMIWTSRPQGNRSAAWSARRCTWPANPGVDLGLVGVRSSTSTTEHLVFLPDGDMDALEQEVCAAKAETCDVPGLPCRPEAEIREEGERDIEV